MSTKTGFKRIALTLVVALGFGMMSTAPSSANLLTNTETLTIDAATDTALVAETATAVITSEWGTTQSATNTDSNVIRAVCSAPSGASCPTVNFWLSPSSETSNISVDVHSTGKMISTAFQETATSTTGGTAKAVVNVKAENFSKAGTYVYTFYTTSYDLTSGPSGRVSTKSVTWTITVSDRDVTATAVNTYVVDASMSSALTTLERYRTSFLSPRESSVTAVRGTATTPVAVAFAAFTVKNAAGDTVVAGALDAANSANANGTATPVQDTLTVTVSGPGLVSVPTYSTTVGKSATLNAYNRSTLRVLGSGETLVVWSDGTAGTSTISISKGSSVLDTFTVTFTGAPASASVLSVTDTVTAMSATAKTDYFRFKVYDSGANELTTGNTVYVYASDTKIVTSGALSTSASQYTQSAAGVRPNISSHACTYDATIEMFGCDLTINDTGVATLYVRDSWTVTGSTWVSSGIDVTGIGNSAKSWSISFDKTSYNVGDQAIITITGKDAADRAVSNSATLGGITTSYLLGNSGNTMKGTAGIISATSTTFTGYVLGGVESGIETRVVTMPSTSGTFTISFPYTAVFSTVPTTASASVKVVNPTDALVSAAQAAAEAATDAANEAIDAANAATDAANLS
ncbi:MAG: hypothetical protein EBX92_08630, partial [Actinobacteria bacterium]|nr:hypothetical protein [Actinomycetota bacterium]